MSQLPNVKMEDDEIILPSSIPFIKSINQHLKKYLNEEEDALQSAKEILSLINFSECTNQTLQQEDVESICGLLGVTQNILDVNGKDMIDSNLITPETISELISTMFRFLIDIHNIAVLEENVMCTLLESQEFLLSNFPSTFQNFINDITNMIPLLFQIYLSFFPNNGSKEYTGTSSIMFLPSICKFTIIDIHSVDQCIVIQKYATNILKILVGRHPIIAQHQNIFNNICNQLRYSSSEIKLLSIEILTILSRMQPFDPTIYKNLINLIIVLLNGYYGLFPSYRTMEFDDLFADLLNSTIDEMLQMLSYFGIERTEMINSITTYLYWNICNSKSEKFKKQIIKTLCSFIDKYIDTDLGLLLKGIEAIKECFQNHTFPNCEDFIDLIKKYLSIHYSTNITKRKESQTDSQGKRRKLEEGDYIEELNSSFSSKFPSNEFGENFYIIESEMEYGRMLFETLSKYAGKCSQDESDITEMYIILMSLSSFGSVKDNMPLIEVIDAFINYTKKSTEHSRYPMLMIDTLLQHNIPQYIDIEKIDDIKLYCISKVELHSKEMEEDIIVTALKNIARFYQNNFDESCKTVILEQLDLYEGSAKAVIKCFPDIVKSKMLEPEEASHHLKKLYSNADYRSVICEVIQETIHECLERSTFRIVDWDFILESYEMDKRAQLQLLKCIALFIEHIRKEEIQLHFEDLVRYLKMIMDSDIEIVAYATSIFSIWITPNKNGIVPIECIYELHDDPVKFFVEEIEKFLRKTYEKKTENQEHIKYFFYIIPLLKQILDNCPKMVENILLFFIEVSLDFDQSSIVYISLKKLADNKGILKYLSSKIGIELYTTLFRYWVKNHGSTQKLQIILSSLFDMKFLDIAKKISKHIIPDMAVRGELASYGDHLLSLNGISFLSVLIIDYIENILTEFIRVENKPLESFEIFKKKSELSSKVQLKLVLETAFKNIIMKLLNDEHKEKIKKVLISIGEDKVAPFLDKNISGISIKISKAFKDRNPSELKQRKRFNILLNMIDVFKGVISRCFKDIFEIYISCLLRCTFKMDVLESFENFMMNHLKSEDEVPELFTSRLHSIISSLCKLVDSSDFGSKLCLVILKLIKHNQAKLNFNLLHLSKRTELEPINIFIEQKIGKQTLDAKLEYILHSIIQSDVAIKHNALETLVAILSENKEIIQRKTLSLFELSESSINIINKLVAALLKNCSDTQESIKLLSATALSEIGAIDPAALNIEPTIVANKEKTDVELIEYIFDHTEISPCSNTKISYVRQELSKILNELDKKKYTEICKKYKITEDQGLTIRKNIEKPFNVPLFKGSYNNDKWTAIWAKCLISKMKGLKTKRASIFTAVRSMISSDKVLVKIILPYLVHHVLLFGSPNDRKEIVVEITTVIDHDQKMSACGEHYGTTEHAQTIFCLIDDLKRWFEMSSPTDKQENSRYREAEETIRGISLGSLAATAFNHSAFSRSLMYYEEFIRDQGKSFRDLDEDTAHNLQKIYSQKKDRDSMEGLASVRPHSEIKEMLLDKEVEEKWTYARDLYEVLLENQDLDTQQLVSLLKCYMNLGQYNTMFQIINGYPLDKNTKATFTLQAQWRLGLWNEIDSSLEQVSTPSFDTHIAKLFSFYVKKDNRNFDECLIEAKKDILTSLSAGSSESYLRCYPDVLKLQVLSEIEKGFRIFYSSSQQDIADKELSSGDEEFLQYLDKNLKITTNSSSDRELLYSVRRCIFKIHQFQENISELWLHISKQARKEKQYQIAETALARSDHKSPLYAVEKAKLLYETGYVQKAIPILLDFLQNKTEPSSSHSTQKKTDLLSAKIKLLTVNWERDHKQKTDVVRAYKEVIDIDKQWEEGYFFLASYLDKSYSAILKNEEKVTSVDLSVIIQNYGQSIKYGIKNIFNSLPRLLTLWMEFELSKISAKDNKVDMVIIGLIKDLPDYVWAVSLPFVYSRITHQSSNVRRAVKQIITKVLLAFPEESIWTIGCRSEKEDRKKAIKEIIDSVASSDKLSPVAKRIIDNQKQTLKGFHELCQVVAIPDKTTKKVSLSTFKTKNNRPYEGHFLNPSRSEIPKKFKYLPSFIATPCNHFIIPIQSLMSVELQKANIFDEQQCIRAGYSPYSSSKVYIKNLVNDALIMPSLQKPKKVGIVGSDGNIYNFLFKANDDIRKDNRMMDLNAVINRILKRDKKTRNKRLYLRLFSAIPLSNNTGLVEWVPNTNVLRKLIDEEYARLKKAPLQTKLLENFTGNKQAIDKSNYGRVYDYVLKEYPPVFGKYFLRQFLEPNQWYQSRLNFVKTAAVWSMVGYIVGLGDRHSENILIDSMNGDTIHVDLAMLFETGKLLAIPEKVPFRLTRNMIDGMGVTGYEGAFRLTCEASLELLRKNNETLLNVLETFKHDPLLDWEQLKKKKETNQAKKAMSSDDVESAHKVIGQKLQGIVGDSALPLSIPGQVDHLINEATNEENLKSMYVWWMPYL